MGKPEEGPGMRRKYSRDAYSLCIIGIFFNENIVLSYLGITKKETHTHTHTLHLVFLFQHFWYNTIQITFLRHEKTLSHWLQKKIHTLAWWSSPFKTWPPPTFPAPPPTPPGKSSYAFLERPAPAATSAWNAISSLSFVPSFKPLVFT